MNAARAGARFLMLEAALELAQAAFKAACDDIKADPGSLRAHLSEPAPHGHGTTYGEPLHGSSGASLRAAHVCLHAGEVAVLRGQVNAYRRAALDAGWVRSQV